MTLVEILNLSYNDMMKMDKQELKNIVNRLTNVSKQRIKNLTQENIINKYGKSYALNKLEKEGGIKIPRNASINQLRSLYTREKKFLLSKTSTIRGLKKYDKEIAKRTNTNFDKWDIKDKKIVWNMIDQIREYDPTYFVKGYESDRSINTIMNYYENENKFNIDNVYEHLINVIKQENIEDDDFFL